MVLEQMLPFEQHELEFLDALIDKGEIIPDLLTDDDILRYRISQIPGLRWKALNVKKYRDIKV